MLASYIFSELKVIQFRFILTLSRSVESYINLWGVIGILLPCPFSWQRPNPWWQSLAFIIIWRVVDLLFMWGFTLSGTKITLWCQNEYCCHSCQPLAWATGPGDHTKVLGVRGCWLHFVWDVALWLLLVQLRWLFCHTHLCYHSSVNFILTHQKCDKLLTHL